jgi:hypothetical protein
MLGLIESKTLYVVLINKARYIICVCLDFFGGKSQMNHSGLSDTLSQALVDPETSNLTAGPPRPAAPACPHLSLPLACIVVPANN